MQHSPSPFSRLLFQQKSSIIDIRLSSKYACPKNYHTVLTLKSMFSFQIAVFRFFPQRNPYTAHNVG